MSDHIPFEIQVEIIKRLPIKSLIRFRSVSKPWKSLIHSSEFIADYKVHHSQPQRLLVSYYDLEDYERKYVLIDDDDTFPQRKCSLNNVPLFINRSIKNPEIIGISQGLLCLLCYINYGEGNRGLHIVVLWNPSIQKSVVINVPNVLDETVVGFGVCPHTNDPKLVTIDYITDALGCISWQVEVFTLSSRAWRRIPCRNLSRRLRLIAYRWSSIVTDGFIYWFGFYRMTEDLELYNLIISFDLTSEEFREIYLPEHLAQQSPVTLSISKLRDSLLVLDRDENGQNLVYGVWMMEHGVPSSFRKLFTFDVPNVSLYKVVGCRENGQPMLETIFLYDVFSVLLQVYEPSSKRIKDLGINGKMQSFFVSSYMETLLLLDQQGYT